MQNDKSTEEISADKKANLQEEPVAAGKAIQPHIELPEPFVPAANTAATVPPSGLPQAAIPLTSISQAPAPSGASHPSSLPAPALETFLETGPETHAQVPNILGHDGLLITPPTSSAQGALTIPESLRASQHGVPRQNDSSICTTLDMPTLGIAPDPSSRVVKAGPQVRPEPKPLTQPDGLPTQKTPTHEAPIVTQNLHHVPSASQASQVVIAIHGAVDQGLGISAPTSSLLMPPVPAPASVPAAPGVMGAPRLLAPNTQGQLLGAHCPPLPGAPPPSGPAQVPVHIQNQVQAQLHAQMQNQLRVQMQNHLHAQLQTQMQAQAQKPTLTQLLPAQVPLPGVANRPIAHAPGGNTAYAAPLHPHIAPPPIASKNAALAPAEAAPKGATKRKHSAVAPNRTGAAPGVHVGNARPLVGAAAASYKGSSGTSTAQRGSTALHGMPASKRQQLASSGTAGSRSVAGSGGGGATPAATTKSMREAARQAAVAQADAAVKALAHPQLELWLGRDPHDPYEPFFVSEEDDFYRRARRSYIVQGDSRAASMFHHSRARSSYVHDFDNVPDCAPDLGDPETMEGAVIVVHPAKRRTRTENSVAAPVEPGADTRVASNESEPTGTVDVGYIAAVRAASNYNSFMRAQRERFQNSLRKEGDDDDDDVSASSGT